MPSRRRSFIKAYIAACMPALIVVALLRVQPVLALVGRIEPLVVPCLPFIIYGLAFGSIYPKRFEESFLGLVPLVFMLACLLVLSVIAAQAGTGDMRGMLAAMLLRLSPPIVALTYAGILVGMPLGRLLGPSFDTLSRRIAQFNSRKKAGIIVAIVLAALYLWVRPLFMKPSALTSGEFNYQRTGQDER